jgi:hypothetical protein
VTGRPPGRFESNVLIFGTKVPSAEDVGACARGVLSGDYQRTNRSVVSPMAAGVFDAGADE